MLCIIAKPSILLYVVKGTDRSDVTMTLSVKGCKREFISHQNS